MIEELSFLGMVLSIGGAVFTSGEKNQERKTGFVLWVVSNFLWVIIALSMQNIWMMLMYIFFFATSVRGIYSNKK